MSTLAETGKSYWKNRQFVNIGELRKHPGLPLNFGQFLFGTLQFDNVEQLSLIFRPKDASWNLPEELLDHGSDRVDGEAVRH